MRFRAVHVSRRWRRPVNHLDGRVCPDCKVTVHGWEGQRRHAEWHAELAAVMQEMFARTGLEEDQFEVSAAWAGGEEDQEEPERQLETG